MSTADATIAHFTAGAIAEVRDGKLAYDAFYFDQMAILGQLGQPWVNWSGLATTLASLGRQLSEPLNRVAVLTASLRTGYPR